MTAPDPGTDPFLAPPLDAEHLALLSPLRPGAADYDWAGAVS